jgi:PKD repeat protein
MQRFAPLANIDGFSFESPETWLVTGGYPALVWEPVTDYEWDFDGDSTPDASGQTATHAFSAPGTYSVSLTVSDAADNTATDTLRVDVVAANGTDDTNDTDGTNRTDGTDGTDESDDQNGENVTIQASDDGTNVTVRNVTEPQSISVDRIRTQAEPSGADGSGDGNGESRPRNVAFDSVGVTVENVSRAVFDVRVREHPQAVVLRDTSQLPAETRQFTRATGTVPVSEVIVTHSVPDDRLSNVTFAFSLRKSYLTERNVTAGAVRLYRSEITGWRTLGVIETGENDTHHRFRAESPGFSRFVIGIERSIFETNASLESAEVERGEAVTVTARVQNIGRVAGTETVTLRQDDAVLERQTVSVDARSSETVTFTVVPETAGDPRLSVAGTPLSLLVTDSAAGTPTPDESSGAIDTETNDRESSATTTGATGDGFGAGQVAVAVVAVALLARHRRC